ncbi:MAG: hypothetical protein J6T51_03810 [Kiritimatiellae bacterium]|nr:hypothetical protein [Kiritimatiellia bacterium]
MRGLLVKSAEHWEGLEKVPWWCGYSYSWAGCFEARLGRGDRAYRYLKDFQRAFVSRNGFHLNGDQLQVRAFKSGTATDVHYADKAQSGNVDYRGAREASK